ncbi:MAG: chemotaxis protein CheW [Xanthobacteraceae bacterium]|nr:chemotaxis protein CheW [Xanthobacteraceae bacterium]MBX3534673.1 chemotaxis protein CheW [Xanthobacteraceae bacterium]MBX3549727.1 chemotaxis protein CheW [Xanthobacteraceae bacterium]MCW5675172.1 chemotaxis protein CheW [Xanthobacteraceae bacterium]MCW5676787.1 chemotaxis protein CheW [Xanthobacteraceae bacterium]
MSKAAATETEFVTAWIAEQLFGIPITRVHDVFEAERITRVPLAPSEISGVLNLRGRVVTALDMRKRLGLPPREDFGKQMAIGIDHDGEAYGLLVDGMGEVLKLSSTALDAAPINLQKNWAAICSGIYRLEDRLMVVLDVDKILDFRKDTLAA